MFLPGGVWKLEAVSSVCKCISDGSVPLFTDRKAPTQEKTPVLLCKSCCQNVQILSTDNQK